MTAQAPAFCPRCGAQATLGARFCPSCGLDFSAATTGAPATAPQPGFVTPVPAGRTVGAMNGPALGMLAGGIVVIVGSFMPWLTATAAFVGTISRSGIDGGGDGIFTAIAGGLLALGGVARAMRSGSPRTARVLGVLSSVVAALIGVMDIGNVNSKVADLTSSSTAVIATVGTGLYVVILGAAIGLLFSFLTSASERTA